MTLILANSAICFAFAIIMKLIILKIQPAIDRASLFKACTALFLLIAIIMNLLNAESHSLTAAFLGGLSYLCLYVLYAPFYYTISHSISVRTIRRLLFMNNQSITLNDAAGTFASREFLENRLYGMSKNGYLICDCRKYSPSNSGRKVALVFSFLKKLWKLGPGG